MRHEYFFLKIQYRTGFFFRFFVHIFVQPKKEETNINLTH